MSTNAVRCATRTYQADCLGLSQGIKGREIETLGREMDIPSYGLPRPAPNIPLVSSASRSDPA